MLQIWNLTQIQILDKNICYEDVEKIELQAKQNDKGTCRH